MQHQKQTAAAAAVSATQLVGGEMRIAPHRTASQSPSRNLSFPHPIQIKYFFVSLSHYSAIFLFLT